MARLTERQMFALTYVGNRVDLGNPFISGLVNLSDLDLKTINLDGANLAGVSFQRTNLEKASLRGANLRNADFTGANLSEVDFTNADLSNAVISQDQIDRLIRTGGRLSGTILEYKVRQTMLTD